MKKHPQFGSKLPSIILLGLLISAGLFQPAQAKTTHKNTLQIIPQKQAPFLCGTTVAEMILRHAGIKRIGKAKGYLINQKSRGSAVAQHLCDLMAEGKIKSGQPQCVDAQGNPLRVYHRGKPTKATRQAYKKGTYLLGLKQLFALENMPATYQRSVYQKKKKQFAPHQTQKRFEGLLKEVKQSKAVIIHVTPHLKPGGGHYLLIYGYNDHRKWFYYIDPNPRKGHSPRSKVSYIKLKNGTPWFRGSWFWTGRYLAVTPPKL